MWRPNLKFEEDNNGDRIKDQLMVFADRVSAENHARQSTAALSVGVGLEAGERPEPAATIRLRLSGNRRIHESRSKRFRPDTVDVADATA